MNRTVVSRFGTLSADSGKEVKELERGRLWGDCGGVLRGDTMERDEAGLVKRRVGGFHTRGTRAAVPHLGAALLNGKNGDNKKSVGVVDDINEGNTDIVVGRDCELTCGCELCQSAVSKQADG